jgi:Ca2+/Na+ antiporter
VNRRTLRIGGIVAGVLLLLFGVGVIVLSLLGGHEVRKQLKQQHITGTSEMTPDAIKAEVDKAGLKNVSIPKCDVAGKPITSGSRAYCFGQYMNVHALLATGGYAYAEMGQYEAKPGTPSSQLAPGGGTNNADYAAIDPKTNQPVQNSARNVWVTETALSTGLDVAFMASLLVLFSLVVGVALLLAGAGFVVLARAALPRAET